MSSRMAGASYTAYRRQSALRESDLAGLDEDEVRSFNWKLVPRFGPYVAPYRKAALTSVGLMLIYTATNLANPYLIGLAIDSVIVRRDVAGLTSSAWSCSLITWPCGRRSTGRCGPCRGPGSRHSIASAPTCTCTCSVLRSASTITPRSGA